jgi:hypothetical protein
MSGHVVWYDNLGAYRARCHGTPAKGAGCRRQPVVRSAQIPDRTRGKAVKRPRRRNRFLALPGHDLARPDNNVDHLNNLDTIVGPVPPATAPSSRIARFSSEFRAIAPREPLAPSLRAYST